MEREDIVHDAYRIRLTTVEIAAMLHDTKKKRHKGRDRKMSVMCSIK